ncbi:hypothetical protein XELAEV_18037255mg [Xenopus laevis]|uniref:Uncharacterized protein n=1 Tax=Xenopus laevis TaxID=8355 RepID=A0A974CCF1_XENLA|nr:hypothetical protein XELAEV_18037255mg [Xenopus laevis]
MWLCYINNIILIWSGTREKFYDFSNTLEDFKGEAKKLYFRFKQRAYKKALEVDRSTLLIPRSQKTKIIKKTNENSKVIRVIGDFCAEHEEIKQILNKHWHILEQDYEFKKLIGARPTVTFRQSKNLNDQLTHSHYSNAVKSTWLSNKIKGCYKCGTCKACPWIKKTVTVERISRIM